MTAPTEKWARYLAGSHTPSSQYSGIRELVDYAVQLERANKALSVNAENLEIARKQRDEALDIARKLLAYIRLEHYCLCGHGADRHNNAAHCDMCECKEYQG